MKTNYLDFKTKQTTQLLTIFKQNPALTNNYFSNTFLFF